MISRFAKVLLRLCTTLSDWVLVGSLAFRFYGYDRVTVDIDLFWIADDFQEAYRKLSNLGSVELFLEDGFARVVVEGIAVEFIIVPAELLEKSILLKNTAVRAREFTLSSDIKVRVAAPEELVALKILAGRHKDFADAAYFLENVEMDRSVLMQELKEVFEWNPERKALCEKFFPELVDRNPHP